MCCEHRVESVVNGSVCTISPVPTRPEAPSPRRELLNGQGDDAAIWSAIRAAARSLSTLVSALGRLSDQVPQKPDTLDSTMARRMTARQRPRPIVSEGLA